MKTVTLHIQRGSPGEAPYMETFQVPHTTGMSVLDALIWIRANREFSLAIRYSYTNANSCKECMVEVDGKVRYACTERLDGDPVTIGPLSNKRLLRDLVADIVPPKETLAHALINIDDK